MSGKQPQTGREGAKIVKRSFLGALFGGLLIGGPVGALIGLGLGIATGADNKPDTK